MDIFWVSLIARYDVTLAEHLRKAASKKNTGYLSWCTQNTFFDSISESVLGQICAQIKAPAMCLHTPQKVGSCAPDGMLVAIEIYSESNLRGIPQSRFYHITGQINPGFAVTLGFPFQNEHGMLVSIETYIL